MHVGLDESFQLGRHPLSAAEVAEIGLAAHFGRYVQRLGAVAAARGLRIGLWADMLALLPEAIGYLPPGSAAYDWYYYPFDRLPRIELRGFATYDLAPALRARGVEYWGCPMDGAFRHEPLPVFGERLANIRDWWRRCRAVGAQGMLVTSWEPYRLAIEMTTVVDAAAASLWLDPESDDAPAMLAAGFRRMHRVPPERAVDLSRRALACDEMAFAGYARWELDDRWDTCDLRRGWGVTPPSATPCAGWSGAGPRRPGPSRPASPSAGTSPSATSTSAPRPPPFSACAAAWPATARAMPPWGAASPRSSRRHGASGRPPGPDARRPGPCG